MRSVVRVQFLKAACADNCMLDSLAAAFQIQDTLKGAGSYGLPGVRRTEGWPLNPWLGHRGLSVHPGGSPKDPVYRQRMALRFRHRKADLDRTTSMGLSSPAAIKWHGAVQPQLCDDSSPPSPEQQGQQLTGIISS